MKAVFFGRGTLLLQCAEAFRDGGGDVCGILSADPRVARWCAAEGIALLGDLDGGFDGEVDYLFSVGTLRVLPEALLARARRMAVNFHDGPLPGRAGLNVPVWAILEEASEHGITWHEMTAEVDAGRVLATRRFAVRADETAVSLNARCYEEGLAAFRALVPDLVTGLVTTAAQAGESRWHGGTDRPAGLGLIDPAGGAEAALRLVRALDFGAYANPLCLPKLWTGERLVAVAQAERVSGATGEPGSVLPTESDGVIVAFRDGALRLSGLRDMAGRAVAPGEIAGGGRLPGLPAGDLEGVGEAERHWRKVLGAGAEAVPPFPRANDAGAGYHGHDLGLEASAGTLAAAWAAWSAAMTGAARGTLCLCVPADHPALSEFRPVTLEIAGTPASLTEAADAALGAAAARPAMAADLPLRLGLALPRVVVTEGAMPAGAEIVLVPGRARLCLSAAAYAPETAAAMAAAFALYLERFVAAPELGLDGMSLGAEPDLAGPDVDYDREGRIEAAIARTASERPGAIALEAGGVRLSYQDLEAKADRLAGALAARGAGPGSVVGLALPRTADLVVAMLAILKTGAAYLPLDPDYPVERIRGMVADAGAALVVADAASAATLELDAGRVVSPLAEGGREITGGKTSEDLAYLIYTSGSTGTPKGVMVPHRTVMNFFAAMDRTVPMEEGARLFAVTSVSFDISVLEILWTLSRGATVVLRTGGRVTKRPDFSLFYFASEAAGSGHDAYRLLLEGATFADENGFEAVWTPERHFHAFGGLYPNPAITAAALAGTTKNIKLRAGSCVLPLHHPVRVAEDWALVDNLSNGRAGVAIASGWQPNDFLLRPESFADRKGVMLEGVETIRALWRGETREFPGHDGKPVEVAIHPKPVRDEIPLWLTAAGNPETFAAAARLGCGVLTHLLGQTLDEVGEKIRAYRAAWKEAGHPGEGHVVLMLHTFVGESEEEVLAAAKGPMKSYLKSAVDLVRRAAWTFPTIVERAGEAGKTPQEVFDGKDLSDEETDQLLEHAFARYYRNAGLFGTPETAAETVAQVAAIGADEIGCLIDFGIETDTVLANLPRIREVMDLLEADGGMAQAVSVADELAAGEITHLQCTPSMARMIAGDPAGRAAVGRLSAMLVGGEALPPDLARELGGLGPAALLNMYGPTETTIWSSTARLGPAGTRVPLGAPIANTVLSVRGPDGRALPNLAEGELWIGGEGVTAGYWRRPELTSERFAETPEGRFYRTGDLVRRRVCGELEFLGRIDGQVKIRGHRIETGEIEARLLEAPEVRDAAVRAVTFEGGDVRLAAYVTAAPGAAPDVAALKAWLAERLPEVMVPAHVVVLAEMPLTPNGKIDRKALPMPGSDAPGAAAEPAADATEAGIAAIWAEALGLPDVSVTANFFDMGGHSLLVVQVGRRITEALGREVSITDMFRFPTVRSLAAHLSEDRPAGGGASARGAARAAARRARMGRR